MPLVQSPGELQGPPGLGLGLGDGDGEGLGLGLALGLGDGDGDGLLSACPATHLIDQLH